MFIVGMLSWWYGRGWLDQVLFFREKMAKTLDYFSIDLLLKTLFAPYRQIGAGRVQGSLGVKWRAFVDRLISRLIGSIVRMILVLIGVAWLIIQAIVGTLLVVLWALVPLMPIIGLLLYISGWVPAIWS